MNIFETFKCATQILSNSLCQFWNEKLIPVQILYPSSVSWKILPQYFFSSINLYFAQKEPIKIKIFETLECSGQILSNSLCQFWNDESIPLQILHHSWLPWHVTSLWILSSHFSYIGLKDPINMPILRLSVALVKICYIPHVIFLSFSSSFASLFSVMKDNSSVFF